MNEPSEVVSAVLQTHDLHALTRLRLLLTNHTLNDVDEDKQVVELYKGGELACKLIIHLWILVHKIFHWHRCKANILRNIWLLIPRRCIFKVIICLVLSKEVGDVWVYPDGFLSFTPSAHVRLADQRRN